MGKSSRVQKEKKNNLEEELMKVKNENVRLLCENDVLQRELAQLRNELSVERRNFLNQMSVYINANEELEQEIKLFDDIKNRNKDLEEKVKKMEEENSMLKKELSTVKQEKECLNVKPFVCDVSCDTNDSTDYTIKKFDFINAESVCDEKKSANVVCYDNNIGLKIMKRMGFKGKGLGKHDKE